MLGMSNVSAAVNRSTDAPGNAVSVRREVAIQTSPASVLCQSATASGSRSKEYPESAEFQRAKIPAGTSRGFELQIAQGLCFQQCVKHGVDANALSIILMRDDFMRDAKLLAADGAAL